MRRDDVMIDFDNVTMPYSFFLKIIGILPFKGRSYNFLPSKIFISFFIFTGFLNISVYCVYPVNRLFQGSLILDSFGEMVVACSMVTRYYMLIPHRKEFRDVFEELRDMWNNFSISEKYTVIAFVKKVRKIYNMYLFSTFAANVMYYVTALTIKLPPLEANGTTYQRNLPLKWYKEVDSRTLSYKFFFMTQALAFEGTSVIVLGMELALPFIIMILSSYFRVLQDRFLAVAESNKSSRLDKNSSKDFAKTHQRILHLCTKIDNIAKTLFFVQVLCTGYIISVIGIQLLSSDPSKYRLIPMLLLALIQMYVVQWAPNFLLEESAGVSTAAYFASFPWMNHQISQNMMITIIRSQFPVQLTASGVIKLSLETYCSMFTSAISFFTVLRNLKV